jgi:hypothetical protein
MGVDASGSIFYGVRLRSSQVIDLRRRCNDELWCSNCDLYVDSGSFCTKCGQELEAPSDVLPSDFFYEDHERYSECSIKFCGYDNEPDCYYVVISESVLNADGSWDAICLQNQDSWVDILKKFFNKFNIDFDDPKWYLLSWLS